MNENIKSKLSGLRGLGKSGRELTASDIRLLLDSIFDNGLGDGVSDVTGLGLDSNLFYGVNVLGSGLLGDKTIRLPNPPIKGRVVKIINNTGYVIYVRPSVEGGSINGVVDGSAGVPSDGKIYEFVCWENPLPGAWSWTPPATGQYDSGEMTIASIDGNSWYSGHAQSTVSATTVLNQSTDSYDGLNSPLFRKWSNGVGLGDQACFRPAIPWTSIKKLKVYTNATTDAGGMTANIVSQGGFNWYDKSTMAHKYYKQGQVGPYGQNIELTNVIAGTGFPLYVSPNIGDPGTIWGEASFSIVTPVPNITWDGALQLVGGFWVPLTGIWSFAKPTVFGSVYCADEMFDGVLCERWFTQSLTVAVIWRGGPGPIFKFRFFIEY